MMNIHSQGLQNGGLCDEYKLISGDGVGGIEEVKENEQVQHSILASILVNSSLHVTGKLAYRVIFTVVKEMSL